MLTAYREVGSFRGAAAICGTTHKTVKRIVARHEAGGVRPARVPRPANYEPVRDLVAGKVEKTRGKISAKRLLPAARAAGYGGSARNFRRLVAAQKSAWRQANARSRRPAVWAPGEVLAIDWGVLGGLHVFCAVLAFSRVRFVRFATDERAETTLGLLAECFETLGGVPKVVLADRMGCLKGGVVADVVVATPDYVRFAAHYRFRPDFCRAADPQSKGVVENLVGYAKTDLMIPLLAGGLTDGESPVADPAAANAAAVAWCAEVNGALHSEIAAIPAARLETERELLGALPSLRPAIGRTTLRKVDKLSCVRFSSARYSVPTALIGTQVLSKEVWECFDALPSQSLPKRSAKPIKRLTALAQALADDDLLPDAGKTAHKQLHAVLDGLAVRYKPEVEAATTDVETVEGETVHGHLGGAVHYSAFSEVADDRVIADAYRAAERVFSADVTRTYAEHLAWGFHAGGV